MINYISYYFYQLMYVLHLKKRTPITEWTHSQSPLETIITKEALEAFTDELNNERS